MSRGWSQLTRTVWTTSRMIVTGIAALPPNRTAPMIGGIERQRRAEEGDQHRQGADGSPQEQVRDAEESADDGDQQRLHAGQDELRAQEAAEGAHDAALEQVRLVPIATRDGGPQPGEDAARVHEHVERQDDDEEERAERRDRHAGDVLHLLHDGSADLVEPVHRAGVEIGQVELQAPEQQAALPVGEHGQDVALRLRVVAGQLGDLLGDRRTGVEQDEAEDDERHEIGADDDGRSRQVDALLEPGDDRRHDEREQPRQEQDEEDRPEAAEDGEQPLGQEEGEVGAAEHEEQDEPPALARTEDGVRRRA